MPVGHMHGLALHEFIRTLSSKWTRWNAAGNELSYTAMNQIWTLSMGVQLELQFLRRYPLAVVLWVHAQFTFSILFARLEWPQTYAHRTGVYHQNAQQTIHVEGIQLHSSCKIWCGSPLRRALLAQYYKAFPKNFRSRAETAWYRVPCAMLPDVVARKKLITKFHHHILFVLL